MSIVTVSTGRPVAASKVAIVAQSATTNRDPPGPQAASATSAERAGGTPSRATAPGGSGQSLRSKRTSRGGGPASWAPAAGRKSARTRRAGRAATTRLLRAGREVVRGACLHRSYRTYGSYRSYGRSRPHHPPLLLLRNELQHRLRQRVVGAGGQADDDRVVVAVQLHDGRVALALRQLLAELLGHLVEGREVAGPVRDQERRLLLLHVRRRRRRIAHVLLSPEGGADAPDPPAARL